MEPLDATREAVREGRYDVTADANREARADDLDLLDVESAILTGHETRRTTDAIRGQKLVVEGRACDLSTRVGVVAALRPGGGVVTVTVYEIEG